MHRPRRHHAPAVTAKGALAALRGDRTLVELSQQFDVHPNQITQGKTQRLERAIDLVTTPAERQAAGPDVTALPANIDQLTITDDFSPGAFGRLPDPNGTRCSAPRPRCPAHARVNSWHSRDPRRTPRRSPSPRRTWR